MTYMQSRRPKIFVVYDAYHDIPRQENYLICKVGNTPMGRYARWFGIHRRKAEGIHISLSIQDSETQRMIATDIQPLDYGLSLPPSDYPEYAFEAVFAKDGFVECVDRFNGQNCDLQKGEYLAIVKIATSGKETRYRRKFSVGSMKEDLHWEDQNQYSGIDMARSH